MKYQLLHNKWSRYSRYVLYLHLHLHLPDLLRPVDFLCFSTKKVLIGDTKDVVVVDASFHGESTLGPCLVILTAALSRCTSA